MQLSRECRSQLAAAKATFCSLLTSEVPDSRRGRGSSRSTARLGGSWGEGDDLRDVDEERRLADDCVEYLRRRHWPCGNRNLGDSSSLIVQNRR